MNWTICFLLMCCCLTATCLTVALYPKKQNERLLKPFDLLCIGIFLTAFIGVLPVNYNELSWAVMKPKIWSVHCVWQKSIVISKELRCLSFRRCVRANWY